MDFKSKYNRNEYLNFFKDKLLPEDFKSGDELVELDFKSNYYQRVTYLGECSSIDCNIYEVLHASERDARVSLSRDAFKLVSRFDKNNAIILFVPRESANYRLSLVSIEPKLDDNGIRIKKEYSNPKRFSFVLGENSKTHTPEQYLLGRGRISGIEDLKNRFSVEIVNKDFYNLIAEMFSILVGGKRKKGNKTIEYKRQLVLPYVDSTNDQKFKEFAVRLIGRTVFCWFLKKKKSGNGIPLISDEVLSRFAVDFTSNFYHSTIEPLFFEVLNTPIRDRITKYKEPPYDKIPFLNGGLFEPHKDDYYKINRNTGFSDFVNSLKVPDNWWKEFLDILETYNFTIDENTSIDIDLSVDPEMLGRIFENLLAEINPETGETARKATGSYYTPRPIVEYMVDESLKQYLSSRTTIDENRISNLLDYSVEDSNLSDKEEKEVKVALSSLKTLDPACGSGAFPMGLLQKLLLILQKVDHEATDSINALLNAIDDPIKRKLLENKLKTAKIFDDLNFNDYARKLNVIQRSIYGIDIQPIAAEISKLRFFLSLIVDEVIQDELDNRGIEPLPNLEFKFVCGNTLIPLPALNNYEKLFGDESIVTGLSKIRDTYFTASIKEKPKLRDDFKKLQNKLFDFILNNKDVLKGTNTQFFLLSDWQPFSDEASQWFDPKWMFGISSGFDIVIGNPPWVSLLGKQSLIENKKNANLYLSIYESNTSNPNLYEFFVLRSFEVMNNDGHLVFITPDRLGQNSSLTYLRELILKKKRLKEVIYRWKFENIIADTLTTVIQNSSSLNDYLIKSRHRPSSELILFHKSDYLKNDEFVFKSYADLETKHIVELMKGKGIPLSDFCNSTSGFGGNSKLISETRINSHQIPVIKGACINRFKVMYNLFFEFKPENLTGRTRDTEKLGKQQKILLRKTGDEIIAAYDDTGMYPEQSLYFLYDFTDNQQIDYLLFLLNSRIINWYYQNEAVTNEDATPQLKNYHLDKFPILYSEEINKHIKKNIKNPNYCYSDSYLGKLDLLFAKAYGLRHKDLLKIDSLLAKKVTSTVYDKYSLSELLSLNL